MCVNTSLIIIISEGLFIRVYPSLRFNSSFKYKKRTFLKVWFDLKEIIKKTFFVEKVDTIDVFRPDSIMTVPQLLYGASNMGRLLIDQVLQPGIY